MLQFHKYDIEFKTHEMPKTLKTQKDEKLIFQNNRKRRQT